MLEEDIKDAQGRSYKLDGSAIIELPSGETVGYAKVIVSPTGRIEFRTYDYRKRGRFFSLSGESAHDMSLDRKFDLELEERIASDVQNEEDDMP